MQNQVVSHEEWPKARLDLLTGGKEFTRQSDALTRAAWRCPGSAWRSPISSRGDFNFDYHVSFTPEEIAKGEASYNDQSGRAPTSTSTSCRKGPDEDGLKTTRCSG
ncbi:hypothetical protein EV128_101237 [Rhizobium azibense]|nr:hypothetical protein EV128_101237 [Rhizobium azibense]